MEKAAAIDSVVFVVVRNVIGHNIGFLVWLLWKVALHLSLLVRLDFIPEILRIRARAAVIFRNSCFAVATFRRLSLQKRRAQAWAHSAAFELAKYGQPPIYSLCAASAALARELISCRN